MKMADPFGLGGHMELKGPPPTITQTTGGEGEAVAQNRAELGAQRIDSERQFPEALVGAGSTKSADVRLGDIVHYFPRPGEPGGQGQPQAAIVSHAYDTRAVNLAVFDPLGTPYSRSSIRFYPDGRDSIPEDVMANGGIASRN